MHAETDASEGTRGGSTKTDKSMLPQGTTNEPSTDNLQELKTESEETMDTENPTTTNPSKSTGKNLVSFEDNASLLSSMFLLYLDPLLRLGASRVIVQDDVGKPSRRDLSNPLHNRIKEEWTKELERVEKINGTLTQRHDKKKASAKNDKKKVAPLKLKKPSGFRVLLRTVGRMNIVYALILYVMSALLQFLPVLLLNDLVSYFEMGGSSSSYTTVIPPWAEVLCLFGAPVLISIIQTRHQVILMHVSIAVRTSLSTMLYDKSLSISAAGRARTSTGQVVNMMSNDTNQLQRFFQLLGMTLSSPVTIIIALVLIYREVGNATWVGVAFMIILAPINIVIFKVVGTYRRRALKYSDLRVKMMNEILNGIRIIKFYAWEKPFGKEVGKLRDKELKALTGLAYVSAIGFSFILLSAPIVQPILVFLTYTKIQNQPLTASTAFTTVALFQIMRFPFAFLPMGLLQYVQSRIALTRLENYLALPDLDTYVVTEPPPNNSGDDTVGSITIKNASFSWSERSTLPLAPKKRKRRSLFSRKNGSKSESTAQNQKAASSIPRNVSNTSLASLDSTSDSRVTLHNITLEIPKGSLVAIVGPVGSGKSSVLSAIMGEMIPANESSVVYIPGKTNGFVSYAAQTPWIVNDTLRGNVLFGREYNEERYNAVVNACALADDIAILPAGDMTEIGERGINLSGGQKARVALARAFYSPLTHIALLDDPLSAVDSHVGEHIFSEAINGSLVEGVTRVLVTHHVHFLPRCDMVVVLEEGRIAHYGTYHELKYMGVDFKGAADFDEKNEASDETETNVENSDIVVADKQRSDDTKAKDGKGNPKNSEMKKKGGNLMTTEEKNTGDIGRRAYLLYAKAGGIIYVIIMLFFVILGRASEIMSSFWLAYWAENVSTNPSQTQYYLNIFTLLSMVGIAGLTGRSCAIAVHRLYASRKIHDDLTTSILRASVSFFDVTPIGRVLNRFAADMDKVDLELTQNISQGVNVLFNVLGAVGAMAAATKGAFLVPLLPISIVYYVIQKWFRKTSTELQRVTSIANSPIFTDFSQILSGTSTVRAYGEQSRFFKNCCNSFDNMNAAYSMVQLTNYWLGLRLDLIGGVIMAFIGGLAVATESTNFIPAGWLGVALSYAIEVTGFLKYGVRIIAQVEADMSSVERILYYTEHVEPEALNVIPDKDPKEGTWPNNGAIEIDHASMRYRDGPLVLKDISVKVRGGEKIGVVGRTGSGKSSLMNLLFRICELENDGGKVTIDNIDTSQIGTEVLRLNISIIPQDPVLFSNTVRYNLDPFNKCSDEEINSVLRKVRLEQVIATLPLQLNEMVTEGGENFSQGQRQLLCIARSLLRKPKILVMDEATASIDNETDAMIQKMIRENFTDATVLTIAHRLNTIMDSDRVLVLDEGHVAEFDTVEALMAMKDGIFRGMVEKSKSSRNNDNVDES